MVKLLIRFLPIMSLNIIIITVKNQANTFIITEFLGDLLYSYYIRNLMKDLVNFTLYRDFSYLFF
jgi:hypothetical protein